MTAFTMLQYAKADPEICDFKFQPNQGNAGILEIDLGIGSKTHQYDLPYPVVLDLFEELGMIQIEDRWRDIEDKYYVNLLGDNMMEKSFELAPLVKSLFVEAEAGIAILIAKDMDKYEPYLHQN